MNLLFVFLFVFLFFFSWRCNSLYVETCQLSASSHGNKTQATQLFTHACDWRCSLVKTNECNLVQKRKRGNAVRIQPCKVHQAHNGACAKTSKFTWNCAMPLSRVILVDKAECQTKMASIDLMLRGPIVQINIGLSWSSYPIHDSQFALHGWGPRWPNRVHCLQFNSQFKKNYFISRDRKTHSLKLPLFFSFEYFIILLAEEMRGTRRRYRKSVPVGRYVDPDTCPGEEQTRTYCHSNDKERKIKITAHATKTYHDRHTCCQVATATTDI